MKKSLHFFFFFALFTRLHLGEEKELAVASLPFGVVGDEREDGDSVFFFFETTTKKSFRRLQEKHETIPKFSSVCTFLLS